MKKFTEKEIKEGLNKAYKESGHNAYFGEGFKAGIEFANQGENLPISNVSNSLTYDELKEIIANSCDIEDVRKYIDHRLG